MQEKNTTIRRVRKASKEEARQDQQLWEEHLKDPIVALGHSPKVRGRSALKISAQAVGERGVPQWPMMDSIEA